MNITPIDMQVVIPKATEVGKGQHQRDQQNIFQQQFGAGQFQAEAHRKLRQVGNTEKSEGKKIKKDDDHQNHQDSRQRNKKGQSSSDSPSTEPVNLTADAIRGGHIDIKL